MDRVTILALVTAAVSVCLNLAIRGDGEFAVRHGCVLLFPLAVIAFPEALDYGYRHSGRGFPYSGAGPTPAIILRVTGWLVLIVVIVVHNCMPAPRHAIHQVGRSTPNQSLPLVAGP